MAGSWAYELLAGPAVRPALALVGVRTLTCVGDSHLAPMRTVRRARMLPRTVARIVVVSGASATGIMHPDSRTGARERFRAATTRLRSGEPVLVSLGEVDVGFLAFARAQLEGGTPAGRARTALERYQRFLVDEVLDRGVRPLLLSAIPPVVEDYATWAGLSNKRRLVTAGRQERADLTAWWNSELGRWCRAHGAGWLDLTDHVSEPGTLRIRPEWMHPDPLEHHLHPRRHAELLASLLRAEGFR